MPANTEQSQNRPFSTVVGHSHSIYQRVPSMLVRNDLLLSGVPCLLGAKLPAENTFWTDVIAMGKKYLMDKYKVGAAGLDWQLLKGIPSNIVNEVRITPLTDCYVLQDLYAA